MLKIFYKIFTFFVIYIHHNSILLASENIKKIANEDFINSGKITQNINESELKNNDSTITNNQSNDNDIKDDASIFGAIKKVVDDKKVIKKFEIVLISYFTTSKKSKIISFVSASVDVATKRNFEFVITQFFL